MAQPRDENEAAERAARNRLKCEMEAEERPLNRALTEANRKHGVTFAGGNIGVWGLVDSGEFRYPHLIDTLIEHFQLPYRVWTREAIARALKCKEAQNTEAPVLLMNELKKLHSPIDYPESALRYAIIYALCTIGDNRQVEDTQQLIEDARYAPERKHLEEMLAKIQKRKYKPKKVKP